MSVSRHFFLQAPQCPFSVQKRFSRDHCCQGRSKPGCRIVRIDHLSRLPVMPPSTFDVNWLQIYPQRLPGCQLWPTVMFDDQTTAFCQHSNTHCQTDTQQFRRRDLCHRMQDYKSGTVCCPISDYVGSHTASSGGY